MPRGTERATIASPVAPFNVLPRATVLPPSTRDWNNEGATVFFWWDVPQSQVEAKWFGPVFPVAFAWESDRGSIC